MKLALGSVATTFAMLAFCSTTWSADPKYPDPSPWSFLAGSWSVETPEGAANEFTCELNKAKNCYVLSSTVFLGTLGIDVSNDHSLLAVGYHPGAGYSVGHFKRVSDTTVSGKFWIVGNDGEKTEHTGKWKKTDYGYSYTVDGENMYRWRRK